MIQERFTQIIISKNGEPVAVITSIDEYKAHMALADIGIQVLQKSNG